MFTRQGRKYLVGKNGLKISLRNNTENISSKIKATEVKPDALFFPNLNGLRFLAAFAVIIHHIEQTKFLSGLKNNFMHPTVLLLGSLGVTLFFVLSGFLISYLLISEKESTGTVKIKKFYIRRMLRIWPLYFIIVMAGLFVLPFISFFHFPVWSINVFWNYGFKVLLFLLILPNVALILYPPMPYMKQTWSIGVEEQFYLIWPVIIKYSKNALRPLFIILFSFMMATLFLFWLTNKDFMKGSTALPTLNFIKDYLSSFRVGCMAMGGLAAYVVYYRKVKLLQFIFRPVFQYVLYLILSVLLAKGITIRYFQNEWYSALFALVIINLACNPKSVISLSHRLFEFLGKTSYGIYMYHPLAIILSFKIVQYLFGNLNLFIANVVLYLCSVAITILFAAISYRYIEKYFLQFKHKYSVV